MIKSKSEKVSLNLSKKHLSYYLKNFDQAGKYRKNVMMSENIADVIKIIESGEVNEIYNISGDFEQKNIDTVKKILDLYYHSGVNYNDHINYDLVREGQDVRYSVDDSKLRALGWKPEADFDEEIKEIIKYHRDNFIW